MDSPSDENSQVTRKIPRIVCHKNAVQMTYEEDDDLLDLKEFLSQTLPIRVPPAYFSSLRQNTVQSFCMFEEGSLVGQISWVLEKNLYHIYTLAVAAHRRGEGIGSSLLSSLLAVAHAGDAVQLHVQSGNVDAINLYHRFGFEKVETIPNFYKRMHDSTALLLVKKIV